MNPFRTGKIVLFQVTYDRDWHFFEIIFFVILGIFGVSPDVRIISLGLSTNLRVCMVHSLSNSTFKLLPSAVNTFLIMVLRRPLHLLP